MQSVRVGNQPGKRTRNIERSIAKMRHDIGPVNPPPAAKAEGPMPRAAFERILMDMYVVKIWRTGEVDN